MMVKRLLYFICLLGLGIGLFTWLRPVEAADYFPMDDAKAKESPIRFVPNQGQWQSNIRYRVKLNGGYIFFEDQALTYHFYQSNGGHDIHQPKVMGMVPTVNSHAFRLRFRGSKASAKIRPALKHDAYHNYFLGNDSSKWAGGVPLFGKISYQELYDDIDLRLYGLEGSLKYDFLVKPGADVEQIALEFEGLPSLALDDEGNLIMKTSLRTVTELSPVAYQWVGEQKRMVRCGFAINGKTVTYVFPDGYDDQYPLVIDPTLIFSSYTGSTSNNWGFTATYDDAGNAYGGGIEWTPDSLGMNGYPVTMGSYQQTNRGNVSVTISKFSPNGNNLIYATYLGGGAADQPHSLIVGSNDNLIVFGRTNSRDFPVTAAAYDTTYNGNSDIFVTRFSRDGNFLIGSTYLGGTEDDGINGTTAFGVYTATKWNYGDDARGEVNLDPQGNIIVAAPTKSPDFPIIGSTIQTTYGGGSQDGCIVKLSPTLSAVQWSTYFGGADEDAIHAIKTDQAGNVIIVGGTASNNLPTSPNVVATVAPGGQADGFVAKLSPNGNAIQACTYLGTNEYDQVFLVDLDEDNNIYVTGQTEGAWPIVDPISGTVFQNPGGQQFITKLTPDLDAYTYSTVFGRGNHPNISPTAFLVDRCENVYVTGWGGNLNVLTAGSNTSGLPTTPDAISQSTDGSDFYLIVLSRDVQNLIYGSFLGGNGLIPSSQPTAVGPRGDHVDGGTSRFDKNGIVYHAVCAECLGSGAFPTQPGVYSPNSGFPTAGCNLVVFKLSFDLSGVEANFEPLDDNGQVVADYRGCPPLTLDFDNRSFEGANPGTVEYRWDFGVNGDTSDLKNPTYTYQNPGTYQVRLVIIDSLSCNISDTTFRMITVYEPPLVDAGPDIVACFGDTVTLSTSSQGVVFSWQASGSGTIISANNTPSVEARIEGISEFYVTLTDTNGCEATDTVQVVVNPRYIVAASDDTLICQGGSVTLQTVTNQTSGSFEWSTNPSVPISDPTQSSITALNLDTTTFFYVRSTNSEGCEAFDTVRVEVFEAQTLEDTFVCEGNSIVLATQGGVSFTWAPNDGSLSNTTVASPVASPAVTTTYTVTARSAEGCISTKDILVEVFANPIANAGIDQRICAGDTTTLSGSGGVLYQWSPVGSLLSPDSFATHAFPLDSTTYVLTVTDARGCMDTDSMELWVNPLPTVVANADTTICEGDAVILTVTGAQDYTWSPVDGLSDPTQPDPLAAPTVTTTYIVEGTDINGCQNVDSVEVEVISKPLTSVMGENRACQGGDIVLIASGGERYVWNTGDTLPTITVDSSSFGLFVVTAFIGGCEGIPDSIFVDQEFGFPNAAFEFSPEVGFAPQTFNFTNLSTAASRYEWNFGVGALVTEENPERIFPSAGTFEVMLIAYSEFDCADTAFAEIFLENVTLHVPSAFTPNEDGSNDRFYIGSQGIRTVNFKVFSRWGLKVYEATNSDFQWDGTYQGVPVPEGVYTYTLLGIGENEREYRKVGTITVYR